MMLGAGVIGAGSMGRNHARVYAELDGVQLLAVSDISNAGVEVAERFSARYYSSYLDMVEEEEIDLVSICVPTSLHGKVAVDCIERGLHVLVEKPIASTVEEGMEILRLAEERGVKLTVGHVERFNPAVQRLKEVMMDRIGRPMSMMARRVGLYPPSAGEANVLTDLAVHDIDIFNHLLERKPEKVFATCGSALGRREDHAMVMLEYGGTECLAQVNWITPVKIRELAVTGEKGYAELNYITQELRVFETRFERRVDTFSDFLLNLGSPEEFVEKVDKVEPLKSELSYFVRCVEEDIEPLVTGREAVEALYIAEKAVESCEKGRPIELGEMP